MKEKQTFIPYIIGTLIGFIMLSSFLLGYRFLFSNNARIGSLLITLGLLIYPIYIGLIITLTLIYKHEWSLLKKKQWRISIFVVPLGAVLAVFTMILVFLIFN